MERATHLRAAIKDMGGQKSAAAKLGRSQSMISEYCTKGNIPAELCMQIELATDGQYRAEDMRPDLAATFRRFRATAKPKRAGRS